MRILLMCISVLAWGQDLIVQAVPISNRTPEAIQSWRVQLDWTVFGDPGQSFSVSFPTGDVAQARSLGATTRPSGVNSYAALLSMDGVETDLLLTTQGVWAAGVAYLPHRQFVIEPDETGVLLMEVDPASYPPCGGALPALAPKESQSLMQRLDSGALIDVMVVYTAQARSAAGGVAAMEATIQAAVDATNTAYANSQIDPRLRLVHTAEVGHADAGDMGVDLNWVASDPGVAALRNTYHADMVSLIVNNGGGACGIGYVQRNPGPGFAGSAFQVTARGCAVGNLSFAHEFGHNQGCEHNPENSSAWPSGGSFPWSFAHYHNGSYRTVMSYSNPCTSGCTRHPYFSNSLVQFMGLPTGVLDQRENYRTINATASIVANFRQGCPVSAFTDWPITSVDVFVSAVNENCLTGP
ncbi:MAG: hypothetical protein KDC35_03935 [Acidobacteria bacterium]|nr:hypothetical protein [Acidobacteriota bacterium]